MKIWGIHKKYPSLSWWVNFMGGHVHFLNVTIFGANAMSWSVNIKTKKYGYICFTLPFIGNLKTNRYGKKYWRLYFYFSPNGTPWACTYYRGYDQNEKIRADIRKYNFGHNFNTDKYEKELSTINNKFSWFLVKEYDLFKFGPKSEEN